MLILIAMELTTVDSRSSPYARYLAGFRLVKWWTGMRFDDTLGLGLKGVYRATSFIRLELTRTKTSGPDRRTRTLYAFIDSTAHFVVPDWFDQRLELLSDPLGFGFPRDYLLPLPAASWG